MPKEINLLIGTEVTDVLRKERQKKETLLSVIFLLIFSLIFISIFSYTFYLQRKAEEVGVLVLAKEQEVEKNKSQEGLYRAAKRKLSGIEKVLAERPDLVPVLDLLEYTTPYGVSFEGIVITAKDKLSLTGKVSNLSVFGEFISSLTEKEFKKYFKQVTLNSLVFSREKGYSFDILIVLELSKNK